MLGSVVRRSEARERFWAIFWRTFWRILARHDLGVSPATSSCYFDARTAPSKKLVWFERSGHEPFVDEPAKFNAEITGLVRPALACD